MARVRVTCSGCGDVTLPAHQVTATVVDEHGGCFAFACPVCNTRDARRAAPSILEVLAASGADVLLLPDLTTLERRPDVGPLTVADAERAVRMIEDDEWFARDLAAHIHDHLVDP